MFDIMHCEGYLYYGFHNNCLVLSKKKLMPMYIPVTNDPYPDYDPYPFYDYIQNSILEHYGHEDFDDDTFWGACTFVPKTTVRIYKTDKKCALDDSDLITKLYGDLDSRIAYTGNGYCEGKNHDASGCYCEKLAVGEHDLQSLLSQYVGKYVHIVIETEVP